MKVSKIRACIHHNELVDAVGTCTKQTAKSPAQRSGLSRGDHEGIIPSHKAWMRSCLGQRQAGKTQLAWNLSVWMLNSPSWSWSPHVVAGSALYALSCRWGEGPEQKMQLRPDSPVLHAHQVCLQQQTEQGTGLTAASHTSALLSFLHWDLLGSLRPQMMPGNCLGIFPAK